MLLRALTHRQRRMTVSECWPARPVSALSYGVCGRAGDRMLPPAATNISMCGISVCLRLCVYVSNAVYVCLSPCVCALVRTTTHIGDRRRFQVSCASHRRRQEGGLSVPVFSTFPQALSRHPSPSLHFMA